MFRIPSAKYRPDLASLMRLCEANYHLIIRLLADKELTGQQRHFFVSESLRYSTTVNEVTRYTSLITIEQAHGSEQNMVNLLRPTMIIRLYHDAQVAEVTSCQNIRPIKPRYDYPNKKMHQPDEKQQVNQFLKEWLQLCLQHGQAHVTLFER